MFIDTTFFCHILTSFSVKYSLLPVMCTLSFVKMPEVPPLNYTTEGISTVNVKRMLSNLLQCGQSDMPVVEHSLLV